MSKVSNHLIDELGENDNQILPDLNDHMISLANIDLCPFCASWNNEHEDIILESGDATREGFCRDCEREWEEIYCLNEIREKEIK